MKSITQEPIGMTESQQNLLMKAYNHIKDGFTHDQICTLATMLHRLDEELITQEIKQREKIKLDSYNERTAWKREQLSPSNQLQDKFEPSKSPQPTPAIKAKITMPPKPTI